MYGPFIFILNASFLCVNISRGYTALLSFLRIHLSYVLIFHEVQWNFIVFSNTSSPCVEIFHEGVILMNRLKSTARFCVFTLVGANSFHSYNGSLFLYNDTITITCICYTCVILGLRFTIEYLRTQLECMCYLFMALNYSYCTNARLILSSASDVFTFMLRSVS